MSRALRLPVAYLQNCIDEEEFQDQNAYDLLTLDNNTQQDIRFAILYKIIGSIFQEKDSPDIPTTHYLGLLEHVRQEVIEDLSKRLNTNLSDSEMDEEQKQRRLEMKFKYMESHWMGTGRIKKRKTDK